VAHHDGLVVVIDTALTPELRAEGDARDIQRAVQDLRRDAGLDLDERVDLWIEGAEAAVEPHLPDVAADTLGDRMTGPIPADATARATVDVGSGEVRIALRRRSGGR
jgi:isoleucyl-tRNA synthetase